MKRETFGSRIGFILVSAGCAIGIGNVWKFPYLCGEYGGAAFILIYLIFLLIMGIPVLVCEFSIGRASRFSVAASFEKLAPEGTKWHWTKWIGIVGSYLLMMFYTTVGGWLLYYCFKSIKGDFNGASTEEVTAAFSEVMGNMPVMAFWTILICVIGFAVCVFGIQKGIERASKFMMSILLVLMIILAIHSVFMEGAGEGIHFYLVPDFAKMAEQGIGNVIFAALSQSFFTLSIGIGAMMIFGSYMPKDRALLGEAVSITLLDTCVAVMAGLIIFPACFAFGVNPGQGPGLVFVTLPNVFREMPGGRLWGSLFFLFMTFAALSTVIAVFQNIIQYALDLWGWELKKSVLVNGILLILLSVPCVLGLTDWSGFTVAGKNIMDLEDFIVSNNLLPLGSVVYLLFCVSRYGWGWDNFIQEANAGKGLKFPVCKAVRFYLTFILPLIILGIFIQGYWSMIVG